MENGGKPSALLLNAITNLTWPLKQELVVTHFAVSLLFVLITCYRVY